MEQIEKNSITWLNLANPKTNDLLFLKDKFRLSSSILSQLPIPIKRPKIEEYSDYHYFQFRTTGRIGPSQRIRR